MPVKPEIKDLNSNSVNILNAIRNDASDAYQAAVPCADNTTESIRAIGSIIMDYQPLKNEFLKNLVNRIGRVLITSKLYENPWAGFKKGLLELGETVEEIFVNIAKPFEYNPSEAEKNVFKREIPDVYAAFHTLNYRKFYKSTINNDQLRQAFLSWNGITDLIAKIVDAMYTAANYDEFLTMKYLIARMALQGYMATQEIPAIDANSAKGVVSTIKGISNTLEFLSSKYNASGVETFTSKRDQFLIMNASADAIIDVEVLASAFNMDKAEFMGRRILVDDFANLDTERLNLLFENDPNFVPITADQIKILQTIPMVLVDKDWFMIFDNLFEFTEKYNSEGLYWNYWYHVWKTFSVSPFANAIAFTTTASTVTAIAVTPATATVAKGQTLQLTAAVTTTGLAPKAVQWSLTGATDPVTHIGVNGKLEIGGNETATELTVTAASTFDSSKTATATITVS